MRLIMQLIIRGSYDGSNWSVFARITQLIIQGARKQLAERRDIFARRRANKEPIFQGDSRFLIMSISAILN